MITALFESLTDALGGFATAFKDTIGSVVDIFWDATGNQLTVVGTLTICALAIGTVYGIIRWISRLTKMRG